MPFGLTHVITFFFSSSQNFLACKKDRTRQVEKYLSRLRRVICREETPKPDNNDFSCYGFMERRSRLGNQTYHVLVRVPKYETVWFNKNYQDVRGGTVTRPRAKWFKPVDEMNSLRKFLI